MEVMARRSQVICTSGLEPSLQVPGPSNPSQQQNNNLPPHVESFPSILVTDAPPVLPQTQKGLIKRYSGVTVHVPISYVATTLRCTMDDLPIDVEETLPYQVAKLKKNSKWDSCAVCVKGSKYSLSKITIVEVEKWAIDLDSSFVSETPSTPPTETFLDFTTATNLSASVSALGCLLYLFPTSLFENISPCTDKKRQHHVNTTPMSGSTSARKDGKYISERITPHCIGVFIGVLILNMSWANFRPVKNFWPVKKCLTIGSPGLIYRQSSP